MTRLFSSLQGIMVVVCRPKAFVIVFWKVKLRTMETVSGNRNRKLIHLTPLSTRLMPTLLDDLHQQEGVNQQQDDGYGKDKHVGDVH